MRLVTCGYEFGNGSPARVDRGRGIVYLAPSFFKKNDDERKFILMHEIGHYALGTRNEEAADRYAADMLADGFGLRRTFNALDGSLHDTEANDRRRMSLYNYLAEKDRKLNGNRKIMDINEEDLIYNEADDTMVMELQHINADGFLYDNECLPDGDGQLPDAVANEYLRWLAWYGLLPSAESVREYVAMKKSDLDGLSDMSDARRRAINNVQKAQQALERGKISRQDYESVVKSNDTRGWWDRNMFSPKQIVDNVFSLFAPEETIYDTEGSGSNTVLLVIVAAVAVLLLWFALKK